MIVGIGVDLVDIARFERTLGVRSSVALNRARSTTSTPMPRMLISRSSFHGAHSTVTDFARLRGWSTSWPS